VTVVPVSPPTLRSPTDLAVADGRTLEEQPELLALNAGEQYRFGFEMGACIGCHSCEVACAEQNGLPPDTVWRRVGEIEGGAHPETRRFHLSMACNHCLEPTCLSGCPTNAYIKLDNGVVKHQADECIGCEYCTWNCPYSVPAFQPDRRIVTKCDMCLPRLEEGLVPACVGACPTNALTVEPVDVEAWRADHSKGDAPNLPSADITLSTTRIGLPEGVPLETFAASDHHLRPEHPHTPLIVLTLLTQLAVGASLAGARPIAAVIAAAALTASLLHLGRPVHAWKAMRNLRRSWLSREVALFGAYATAATVAVAVPAVAPLAPMVGAAGVFASARLYIVPGRPSWNSPLTVAQFGLTAALAGALVADRSGLAAGLAAAQLGVSGANLLRLTRAHTFEASGTVRLTLNWFRPLFVLRVLGALAGIWLALAGETLGAFIPLALAEIVNRYLFYVTVVPLNMPGNFFRGRH
jgi:Fe-S-cluster-containing dehydrogenase component/DMSO reductase anchor subunit